MKLLIIIPTYNEVENIGLLVNEIFKFVDDVSILVIDDNSSDGTQDLVEGISQKNERVFLLKRECKLGLASAYITGMKWGIENGFDIFCEMDADFSHNPKYLPEMIEKIKNNDVVIGSRNIKGGAVQGWSLLRNFISKGGSLYSRFVFGFPPLFDLTGGYNMWRLSALEKIGINHIVSDGYCFQIEMKYKAWKKGCSVIEIPILFENRRKGKSKMSLGIFLEALIKIWKIKQ